MGPVNPAAIACQEARALCPDDIRSVYERNKEQVIRHFSSEDAPISLGVIFDTSSSMYEIKDARNQRRALLIVSDGGENHSRYTFKEVWPVLREAEVQIFSLGIFDEAPRTTAERMGPDLLGAMTSVTGGKTFPIHNLKKIEEAATQLSIELRNEYLLAYPPNNLAHDGRWNIHVTPPSDLLDFAFTRIMPRHRDLNPAKLDR